jgi:hypothetical protein
MKKEALPRAVKQIKAQRITAEGFHYYGQVIFPREDGTAYDHNDAQLLLQDGTPRFYIMHLEQRGLNFDRIKDLNNGFIDRRGLARPVV